MSEGVFFTPEQDAAITRAVRRVNAGYQSRPRPQRKPIPGDAFQFHEGKAVNDIPKGEWGDVRIWAGETLGEESETDEVITAYNRYGDVAAGVWCGVQLVPAGWLLVIGECGV